MWRSDILLYEKMAETKEYSTIFELGFSRKEIVKESYSVNVTAGGRLLLME